MNLRTTLAFLTLLLVCREVRPQQIDVETVLGRAEKLFEEAKAAYDGALAKGTGEAFVEAGFKLEDARIKFMVLQEVGSPEKQQLAADRLRAVNQLAKLIHDGKVAVSGKAVDAPSGRPADPAPTPNPKEPAAPEPAPAPPPPAADVSKRLQAPDPARQKEAEKLIKDLFKDQYAKKAVADRKSLVRALLGQAAKSQDDPAAQWVLFREAQDIAAQVCDPKSAVEAIEFSARVFDVDAMALKNTVLSAASKNARSADDLVDLAVALLKLVDDLIRADQFDAADRDMGLAVQLAKKSTDADLIASATLRSKEVAEAKVLFQSMKSVLQTQAAKPEDPSANLEIGRFLCFVKGSWDLGLRFIVKGSDAALKSLAEKELGVPMQVADRVALGDGWYDLGEKEKSPLRKSQLMSHARSIYTDVLSDAPTLVRAKLEKRLAEMDNKAASAGKKDSWDLLKLIDPAKDSKGPPWRLERGVLINPKGGNGPSPLITVPFAPPDEYDLTLVIERADSGDFFKFGLMSGPNMVSIVMDTVGKSGIQNYDSPMWQGSLLPVGKAITVTASIRRNSFLLVADGKKIVELKKGLDRPSGEAGYPNGMYLQACASVFNVSKLTLMPISGGLGRKTR